MTREGTRLIAAFAVAVLAAAVLSACGSSDSTSTESASSTSTSSAQGAGSDEGSEGGGGATGNGGSDGAQGSGGSEDTNGSGDSSQGGSGSSKPQPAPVSVPLQVSGGGSEQFLTKGGDNSVQEFGEEGDEAELQEAAETVHDFYVARAEGDWQGACSRISQSLSDRLKQLAVSSTELEDKGCASFLEEFTSPLKPLEWREITTVDAGSLRHEGEQAFLIYIGAAGTVYAMPLAREDDAWKVTALSASALG